MEPLLLLVVLVVLFLLLRFYRTGKLKFSTQMSQCADHQSLMIVLKDDIHQELTKKHHSTAFEKALVLLGLFDRLLVVLQDEKFFNYLQDPRNAKGARLLQSLNSHIHDEFIDHHTEVLRETYINSLKTLMQLNRQLNLECDLARWNRPIAEDQKQVPDVAALPPVVKNLFEQRLALCQQILELGLLLLEEELNKIQGLAAQDNGGSANSANSATVAADNDGSELHVKLKPQVPHAPLLRDITVDQNPDLQVQQLYTKYQKLLSLVMRTERLTCLALNQFSLLPMTNTKLSDLGIK